MSRLEFLGITVLGDYILSEGIDCVLESLKRCGATAVACNPTVTFPAPDGTGSFQPPDDAGSSPRLFDRRLWGRRSLWVRGSPSYIPQIEYYSETPYRPREANDLTEQYGQVIDDFVTEAVKAGLKVYLQVGAAQPPNLREEDKPRLPDGRVPVNRMANTASLASPAVRGYVRAYVRDLMDVYPQITGFRPDWPEYPCYKLDEAFQDFSPHVIKWGKDHGYDMSSIKNAVGYMYEKIHGKLTNEDLLDWVSPDYGRFALMNSLRAHPHVAEWFRLKADLSIDLLREWRQALTEYGGKEKELSANAFMPPYTLLTGFDFGRASEFCSAVSPKLYTMHWTAMVEFWGRVILDSNPGLDEALVVRSLANLFDLEDQINADRLSDYGYPQPDEPHAVPDSPQKRKIRQVKSAAGLDMAITPLVHGYGPTDDFARRLQLVAESSVDGIWINRYGYLGDDKLDIIGSLRKA